MLCFNVAVYVCATEVDLVTSITFWMAHNNCIHPALGTPQYYYNFEVKLATFGAFNANVRREEASPLLKLFEHGLLYPGTTK